MQNTTDYLNDLSNTVRNIIEQVQEINRLCTPEQLATRPSPERWSVLDNLEHLSLYGDFYLPLFERTIAKGIQRGKRARPQFRAGWLGGYFVKSMRPHNGKIPNPMKTFKSKNPVLVSVPNYAMKRFLAQQERLLHILTEAHKTDLQGLRIPTTLGAFPKISLGDGLAFIIAHEARHMLQIQHTLAALQQPVLSLKWS